MPEPGSKTYHAIQALAPEGPGREDHVIGLSVLWVGSKRGERKVRPPSPWRTKKDLQEAVRLYGQITDLPIKRNRERMAKKNRSTFIARMEKKYSVNYHQWDEKGLDLEPGEQATLDELDGTLSDARKARYNGELAERALMVLAPNDSRFSKGVRERRAREKEAREAGLKSNPKPKSKPAAASAPAAPSILESILSMPMVAAPVAAPVAPPAPVFDWPDPEGPDEEAGMVGFGELWDQVMADPKI